MDKTLKNFGLLMGGVFFLAAGGMTYKGALGFAVIACILAVGFTLAALAAPSCLKDIYREWMRFAELIGAFNTKLLLGFIYMAVFSPTHLYFWVTGKDPLKRKREPGLASYWEDRVPTESAKYDKQY